ncbi:MAG TPA: GGDEF domain-containing protein [Planctomycetaceae bacterium]|nr:GGDEF domain-containing protein [Planctomycetaceae bacterium]
MTLSAWEETLTKAVNPNDPGSDGGCLLQIHPLSITNHLIELCDLPVVIGRDPSCGICIADASVSRRHALIEKVESKFSVTDLDSTNGTSVNEQPGNTSLLDAGDRIQFGSYIFKFLSSNHIELQYHEAVYSMMTRDGLTGALNKRSFIDILGRDFQCAVHRNSPLSLILFDIDFFKSVNDTHGHLAGDEVLREVGRRISSVTACHDVFARYGGEEFAILMSETTIDHAVEVAQRCRLEIADRPFQTSVGPLAVTISAGVAEVHDVADIVSADHLIHAADLKLYEAKHGGRNRVCK